MQLARIVGNAVMTCAHTSVRGSALFLCQPIDENGDDCGDIVVAINPFGGGVGSKVIVAADGKTAQKYVCAAKSPLRHCIVCILDD